MWSNKPLDDLALVSWCLKVSNNVTVKITKSIQEKTYSCEHRCFIRTGRKKEREKNDY